MRVKLKPLAEQAIVITGASSGVGLATARLAARQGARVLLVARNREALQRAVQEIQARGGEADYAVADVGEASEVEAAAARAIERFGRIDTWINNAATSIFAQPTETPNDAHEKLFRTNYFGMVNGCLAALPYLRLQGGALISVGSVLSDMPCAVMAAYTASKHAVKAFVGGLRIQLAGESAPVSVTLIKPSGIDTPFGQHAYNPGAGQATVPGPVYDPEVVARAILFCATHPRRTLTVGGLGKLATLVAGHFPGLIEWAEPLIGHRFFDYRKSQDGNSLFAPNLGGQVRSGTRRPRRTSLYTAAMMHPVASVGTAVLLGLAGAYLLGRRRRR